MAEVRVVAVEGACRVLGTFWEIVPEAFKKQYLATFVRELVFDQVRCCCYYYYYCCYYYYYYCYYYCYFYFYFLFLFL